MSMASRKIKQDSSGSTSTATVTLSSSTHIHNAHSSIPSHLSGELAFLESLIQRAKDQHRHQPFLQRMKEISRLGRLVLRCIQDKRRQCQKDGNEKLGLLLIKLTQALFRAHRTTCQIIELHHFLPLQLTTIALYARIFTIVLNIGNSVGISAAHLIAGQSVDADVEGLTNKEGKRKEWTKSSLSSSSITIETAKDLDTSKSAYTGSTFKDLDDIGEKIERKLPTLPSTVKSATSTPAPSPSPSLQKIATKAAAAVVVASASRSPAPQATSVPASPTLASPKDDDQPSPRPSSPSIIPHVEQRRQGTPSTFSIPIDNADLRKRTVETTTTNAESKSESTVRASKRSSTDVDLSNKKKLKSKKKKRDTMDDIFGF